MYKKIEFTLDNIVYNCVSEGKNDSIEIILPRRTPTATTFNSKFTREKSIVLSPVVEISIKLYLTVIGNTVPRILIHGENKKSKVSYANVLEVRSQSNNLIVFSTVDGGTSWLINSSVYSKNPSPIPTGTVTSVNNKKGPDIVLDASDIRLKGETGPTIIEQFETVDSKIINLTQTVTSEVTKDVVSILPDAIKVEIGDTEIIAEKI